MLKKLWLLCLPVSCLLSSPPAPAQLCSSTLSIVKLSPVFIALTLRSNNNWYAHKRHHACRQIAEIGGRGLGNEAKMPIVKMAKELHEQPAAELERHVQCAL